ncbi:hypothetical protein [Saccharopolyspora pogona]|nr:hypothetical protein [Saccharopolyspora pogona]
MGKTTVTAISIEITSPISIEIAEVGPTVVGVSWRDTPTVRNFH